MEDDTVKPIIDPGSTIGNPKVKLSVTKFPDWLTKEIPEKIESLNGKTKSPKTKNLPPNFKDEWAEKFGPKIDKLTKRQKMYEGIIDDLVEIVATIVKDAKKKK